MKAMIKTIVVACDLNGAIGRAGKLPWHIPQDLTRFKQVTTSGLRRMNVVVMGRNTWESIPSKYRPLPNRVNVVISSTLSGQDCNRGCAVYGTIDDALESIKNVYAQTTYDELYVHFIGGQRIYKEALERHHIDTMYLTLVNSYIVGCDAHFPLDAVKNNPKWEWYLVNVGQDDTFGDQVGFYRIDAATYATRG